METKHTNLKEIVKLFNKIPHTDNKKNANTKTERNETNKVYGYMSEYNNIDMNKIGGYGNKKRGDQYINLKINGRLFPTWILANFKRYSLPEIFLDSADPCNDKKISSY